MRHPDRYRHEFCRRWHERAPGDHAAHCLCRPGSSRRYHVNFRRTRRTRRHGAPRRSLRTDIPSNPEIHAAASTPAGRSHRRSIPGVGRAQVRRHIHRRDQFGRARRQYAGAEATRRPVKQMKRVQVGDAQRRCNCAPGQFAGGTGARSQDREGERANKAESPPAGPAGRRLYRDVAGHRGVFHAIGRCGPRSRFKDIGAGRDPGASPRSP